MTRHFRIARLIHIKFENGVIHRDGVIIRVTRNANWHIQVRSQSIFQCFKSCIVVMSHAFRQTWFAGFWQILTTCAIQTMIQATPYITNRPDMSLTSNLALEESDEVLHAARGKAASCRSHTQSHVVLFLNTLGYSQSCSSLGRSLS